MDVKINEIALPFWEHDNIWAWKFISITNLKMTPINYIKNKRWKNVILIDSDLNMYSVKDIKIIKPMGLWGWTLKYSGRMFEVEHVYTLIKKLTDQEAKDYLLQFIKEHPDVYSYYMGKKENYDSREDYEEDDLLYKLQQAQTWKEILEILP